MTNKQGLCCWRGDIYTQPLLSSAVIRRSASHDYMAGTSRFLAAFARVAIGAHGSPKRTPITEAGKPRTQPLQRATSRSRRGVRSGERQHK